MSILAIGGAGFIGRRLVPILNREGHDVTVMDIDVTRAADAFGNLEHVKVVRRRDSFRRRNWGNDRVKG